MDSAFRNPTPGAFAENGEDYVPVFIISAAGFLCACSLRNLLQDGHHKPASCVKNEPEVIEKLPRFLKPSNVQRIIDILALCVAGKGKQLVSQESTAQGGRGALEADDLNGTPSWGPGYTLRDSLPGITNTYDHPVRMAEDCIQLGPRPDIEDTVKMVPCDVARVLTTSALSSPVELPGVARRATAQYSVPEVKYSNWSEGLPKHHFIERSDFFREHHRAGARRQNRGSGSAKSYLDLSGEDLHQGTGVAVD
ncbi:hypothetical protein F5X96DRAFT_665586 [Biscogniauxia mediterranea]|nr:hypothetical protein F5X96DRAFT_665586 [Biscogniauxia mediterranea]